MHVLCRKIHTNKTLNVWAYSFRFHLIPYNYSKIKILIIVNFGTKNYFLQIKK